jgi:hypothetical protein
MKTFGVFLFLLWTIFVCTEGKYVKDSISTNKRFNYLTRFCFEEGIGSMTFQATTNQASKLQLAIYFDGNGINHVVKVLPLYQVSGSKCGLHLVILLNAVRIALREPRK